MRSREDVIKLIAEQFGKNLDKEGFEYVPKGNRKKDNCWHYGRVELSDLIDYIYEESNK